MPPRRIFVNAPSQNLLGTFLEGLPKKSSEIPKTAKELLAEEDVAGARRPFIARVLDDGEYEYGDVLNRAKDVVFNVHGFRVIVCPKCKSNVDIAKLQFNETWVKPDDVVVFEHPKLKDAHSVFVHCDKCNMSYILPELVLQRSFRFPFPGEDVESYYLYLKCVWLKGTYRILRGDAVVDVSDSPDGNTWVGYGEDAED